MDLKYKTGQYTVRLFDRYGVKERDIDASSHTEGVQIGMQERGSGSFVVLRCVYNSLDPHRAVIRDLAEGEY